VLPSRIGGGRAARARPPLTDYATSDTDRFLARRYLSTDAFPAAFQASLTPVCSVVSVYVCAGTCMCVQHSTAVHDEPQRGSCDASRSPCPVVHVAAHAAAVCPHGACMRDSLHCMIQWHSVAFNTHSYSEHIDSKVTVYSVTVIHRRFSIDSPSIYNQYLLNRWRMPIGILYMFYSDSFVGNQNVLNRQRMPSILK
jgi:hypothetical protein